MGDVEGGRIARGFGGQVNSRESERERKAKCMQDFFSFFGGLCASHIRGGRDTTIRGALALAVAFGTRLYLCCGFWCSADLSYLDVCFCLSFMWSALDQQSNSTQAVHTQPHALFPFSPFPLPFSPFLVTTRCGPLWRSPPQPALRASSPPLKSFARLSTSAMTTAPSALCPAAHSRACRFVSCGNVFFNVGFSVFFNIKRLFQISPLSISHK